MQRINNLFSQTRHRVYARSLSAVPKSNLAAPPTMMIVRHSSLENDPEIAERKYTKKKNDPEKGPPRDCCITQAGRWAGRGRLYLVNKSQKNAQFSTPSKYQETRVQPPLNLCAFQDQTRGLIFEVCGRLDFPSGKDILAKLFEEKCKGNFLGVCSVLYMSSIRGLFILSYKYICLSLGFWTICIVIVINHISEITIITFTSYEIYSVDLIEFMLLPKLNSAGNIYILRLLLIQALVH